MGDRWLSLSNIGTPETPAENTDQGFLSSIPSSQKPANPDGAFLSEIPNAPDWVYMDPEKVKKSQIISNTLAMPFGTAYDNVDVLSKQFEAYDPGWFKTAGKSLARGIGNTYVTAARAAEWAGLPKSVTNTYLEFGQRLQNSYLPPMKPEEFTFDKLLDGRWWATTAVESVPPMLALVPAAIIGAYGGSSAAGAVGLGIFGKTVLGAIGATALSRPIESAFEAGDSYQEAISQGKTDEQAKERGSFVFNRNMVLGGWDAAQMIAAFTPLRLMGGSANATLTKRILAATGKFVAKSAAVGVMEGAEEAYQTGIQQLARGEHMQWNAEMKEAAALGAVFGIGLGSAGSVFETLTSRLENHMQGKLKEDYQGHENAAKVLGNTPEESKIIALDKFADTPGGKAFIEKEITSLKDLAEGKEPPVLTREDMDKAIETVGEEQPFTLDEEAKPEPDPLAGILTDDDIETIASGKGSIEQALGMEETAPPAENLLVSEESYQAALASLKEKTSGFHAGIDPTALADLVKIGAYHLERGVRTFTEWSKLMIERFGDGIEKHLKTIWEQSIDLVGAGIPSNVDLGEDAKAQTQAADNATQPAKEVKKQVRRTTGQDTLVKMIREDDALAAAFKKAEQASREAYAAGGKDAKEAAKAEFRDVLMKAQAKAEVYGFREGFKVSEKITRKEFISAFQDSQEVTKATQKMMIDYINENLPPEVRGKFLNAVVNQVSEHKAYSVMSQVDDLQDKLTRRELINEIKSLQEFKGQHLAVDYQKKITDLLGDLNTKTINRKTLLKMSGLIDFAESEGMPSGINRTMRENLARLEQVDANDMTTEDLQFLVDTATHLKELGKLKFQLKYKYNQRAREKAKAALVASTHNIDPKLSGQNTQTDKLKSGALYAYMETLPGQRVPELLDNYTDGENVRLYKEIWNAEQDANWDKRTALSGAVEEISKLGIGELTDKQNIEIMINVRNQEGADAATLALMEKHGYNEVPQLTRQEQGLIDILKKYSGADVDKIAALYEETKNEPFVKLPNRILPLKYEGETYVSAEEALLSDHRRTTQAQQGFTQSRKPGVKKVPRVDVLGVFELGLDEQKWYVHVQPVLDDAAKLVKTKDYVEAAGAAGANWWADHLDIMARRGWSSSAHYSPFNAVLKAARGNLAKAILGYRLSSIIMQPFALFDAMAYAGGRWGATASLEIMKEFTKAWVAPGVAKRTIAGSESLQMRAGGEYAIQEALTAARAQTSLKNKFVANGMSLMVKADQITAAGVEKGIEHILEKNGIENAHHEAEQLTDMVSSSSDVSFRPHVLSRGEMARTWFTFGTFALNRWAIIAHDLAGKGMKGNWKAKYNAALGLSLIIAGTIAEDQARKYLYEMLHSKERKQRSLLVDMLFALPQNIPLFGNAFDNFTGGSGSDIPLTKVVADLLGASKAITADKPQAKAKALLKATEAAATLGGGVPGTSQAFDLIESIFLPTGKTGSKGRVELGD